MYYENLAVALAHLYPEATPGLDYRVTDQSDGQGPHLSDWSEATLGPVPTVGQLEDAVVAVHANQTKQRLKNEGLENSVTPLLEGSTDVDQKWEMMQILALKLAEAVGLAELVPPSLADVVNDKFEAIVAAGLTWAQKSAQVDAIATDPTTTAENRKAQLDNLKFN